MIALVEAAVGNENVKSAQRHAGSIGDPTSRDQVWAEGHYPGTGSSEPGDHGSRAAIRDSSIGFSRRGVHRTVSDGLANGFESSIRSLAPESCRDGERSRAIRSRDFRSVLIQLIVTRASRQKRAEPHIYRDRSEYLPTGRSVIQQSQNNLNATRIILLDNQGPP